MLRLAVILLIGLSISFASTVADARKLYGKNDLFVNVAPPPPKAAVPPSGVYFTGLILKDADYEDPYAVTDYHAAHYDKPLPRNFDLRTVWGKKCLWLPEISNQGACGSCWAVSTADVIRDRLCIAYENRWGYLVSAAEFMNCVKKFKHDACGPGHPDEALEYFVDKGVVTGGPFDFLPTCKPYPIPPTPGPKIYLPSDCPAKCTDEDYKGTYEGDNQRGKNVRRFRGKNVVKDIQWDIFLNGPVVATFLVYDSFWDFWNFAPSNAVYRKEKGETDPSGHAIRIIGWGSTDEGEDYWTFLNSWGNDSHRHGEGRILRGTNECHIEGGVFSADV